MYGLKQTKQQPNEKPLFLLFLSVFSDMMSMWFVVFIHVSFFFMFHPESILHGRQDSMDSRHHTRRLEGGQCGG